MPSDLLGAVDAARAARINQPARHVGGNVKKGVIAIGPVTIRRTPGTIAALVVVVVLVLGLALNGFVRLLDSDNSSADTSNCQGRLNTGGVGPADSSGDTQVACNYRTHDTVENAKAAYQRYVDQAGGTVDESRDTMSLAQVGDSSIACSSRRYTGSEQLYEGPWRRRGHGPPAKKVAHACVDGHVASGVFQNWGLCLASCPDDRGGGGERGPFRWPMAVLGAAVDGHAPGPLAPPIQSRCRQGHRRTVSGLQSGKPFDPTFQGRRHFGQLRDDQAHLPPEFGELGPDLDVPGEDGGQ
ncbi:hypothetical protein ACFWAR_00310 [Streptomyces sp. NPDC059917]|uniref:hypothetical protein n=1 Tax=Streptomyces sp. NPDC059917 TaxID=3347002 RepID=UPI003669B2EE